MTPRQLRRSRLSRGLRRFALWGGAPLVLALGLGAAAVLASGGLGQDLATAITDDLIDATAALGLVVADIQVEGRETTDPRTIFAALEAERGTPILTISPQRARERLEALPWVRSAVVQRRLPDTVYVRLVERKPLAVWQHGGRLDLIDHDGAVIPVRDLGAFAQLPTVIGDDAPANAAELIEMLGREPALAARVTVATRVGGRRWDLRIDNAIDVLLPEQNPAGAWAQLAQLDRSSGVLKRDVQAVDMRLPDRFVLRLNQDPAKDAAPAHKMRPGAKNT